MAKIKVCNDCGAVRTTKECSRCEDEFSPIAFKGMMAAAELAQDNPGLVAEMLQLMADKIIEGDREDGTPDPKFEAFIKESLNDLKFRSIIQGPGKHENELREKFEAFKSIIS